MKELIQSIVQKPNSLHIQLKDKNSFDSEILQLMKADENAIRCLADERNKLIYTTKSLISLDYFLKKVRFEKEESLLFLKNLFENAIASNRNKPVLLDLSYMYVSSYGDRFFFIVLPVSIEHWMFQKQEVQKFISQILDSIQTDALEIKGLLYECSHSKECSLPMIASALSDMKHIYYPKKWYQKPTKTIFRLKDGIQSYGEDDFLDLDDMPQLPLPKKEDKYIPMEKKPDIHEEATQLISKPLEKSAFLENKDQRYDLPFETNLIGRSIQCDIRLEDAQISSKHAKITRIDDRYYLQDLKSSNGTFLNDKPVIRKMRLKEGMEIKFAGIVLTFRQ